jgi:hypothetical protein
LASFITRIKVKSKKAKGKKRKPGVRAILRSCFSTFAFLLLPFAASGQRIAILTPDKAESSTRFAAILRDSFDGVGLKLLDESLSGAAYTSAEAGAPFNLTADETKRIGQTIGCEFFVLLRSATLRRSSFQRTEYYESYAAVYLVSARTGRLILWRNLRFEEVKPEKALKLLDESAGELARVIREQISATQKTELAEVVPPPMEEPPDPASPQAKNFRAPIPYRRIKPEYTAEAALYDVAATVDIIIETDASGRILRTEIARWAGYGLDESVEKAVRAMNWRPAERNGKPLPMRFLVRYNFKKLDKE